MQPFETDFCHIVSENDPEQRSAKDPFAPWVSSRTPGILKGTHARTGQVKWMVRYHSGPRTRTSRTFHTLDEAKRFRNEQQERQQASKDGRRVMPPPKQSTPFGRWAEDNYIAVKANPRTVAAYKARLRSIREVDEEFLRLPVGLIGKVDVERLQARLVRHPYKNSYVNAVMALVKGTLTSAAANGHIAPIGFKVPKLARGPMKLTPVSDELVAVVGAAPKWHQALIGVTAILGLRSGEARGLRVDAIDGLAHSLRDGWLYSPDPYSWEVRIHTQLLGDGETQVPVKGAKHRELYPDEAAMRVIVDHLNAFGPGPDGLVFQRFTAGGKAMHRGVTDSSFGHMVHRASVAGVGRAFTPHSLRRFHATARLAGGESVREVSDDLGHSSTEITQRFYNAVMRRQGQRREAFGAVAGAVGSNPKGAAVVPHPTAHQR